MTIAVTRDGRRVVDLYWINVGTRRARLTGWVVDDRAPSGRGGYHTTWWPGGHFSLQGHTRDDLVHVRWDLLGEPKREAS